MKEYINKYCFKSIAVSIILIILAVIFINDPIASLSMVTTVIGIVCIVIGALNAIMYFKSKREITIFNFRLIIGIISLSIGLILVINPLIIQSFIVLIAGIWIILASIIRIQVALNLRNLNASRYTYTLIMAILTLILGIVIIVNPFEAIATVSSIAGFAIIANETINIIGATLMLIGRSKNKE